ncbi:hypothetical protein SL626_24070, partial [Escherichia coli]|uniref:hypothetical protein n=1 Tax=Escherichia coli TaxID=562 RepID=UPI0038628438
VMMAALIAAAAAGVVFFADSVIDALSSAPDILASAKAKVADLSRPLGNALDVVRSIENFGGAPKPGEPQEVVVGQPGLLSL